MSASYTHSEIQSITLHVLRGFFPLELIFPYNQEVYHPINIPRAIYEISCAVISLTSFLRLKPGKGADLSIDPDIV
jgi:hypothetical protein